MDKIYMTFVQSTAGGGGWPLNVFLTPDLKPFFGGTYFPPASRHGRPGFSPTPPAHRAVLARAQAASSPPARRNCTRGWNSSPRGTPRPSWPLTPDLLRQALAQFKEAYDPDNGGFGGAPKFPQPSIPSFVLRAARRFDDAAAAKMVLHTCEKMAAGGIHDQLAAGFPAMPWTRNGSCPISRKCSTTMRNWRSSIWMRIWCPRPDRARGSGPGLCRRRARHPGLCVARHDPSRGGFYSAEDADSEGHGGKVLLLDARRIVETARAGGIPRGRRIFWHHQGRQLCGSQPSAAVAGANVLSVANPKAATHRRPLAGLRQAKMLAARARRVRPIWTTKSSPRGTA